jgi:hypothetical protein
MNDKLEAAIAYLRERKIYIIEYPFIPTNVAKTDVAATSVLATPVGTNLLLGSTT